MGFQTQKEAFNSSGECRQVQLLVPIYIRTNRIHRLLSAATDERLSGIPCFSLRGVMRYTNNIII
jgi:hypothetical protein